MKCNFMLQRSFQSRHYGFFLHLFLSRHYGFFLSLFLSCHYGFPALISLAQAAVGASRAQERVLYHHQNHRHATEDQQGVADSVCDCVTHGRERAL